MRAKIVYKYACQKLDFQPASKQVIEKNVELHFAEIALYHTPGALSEKAKIIKQQYFTSRTAINDPFQRSLLVINDSLSSHLSARWVKGGIVLLVL